MCANHRPTDELNAFKGIALSILGGLAGWALLAWCLA